MHWLLWSCFQDRRISEWHHSKCSFSQVVTPEINYIELGEGRLELAKNRWFCRSPFFERHQIFVIVSRGSVPSLVDTSVSGLFSKNLPMPKSYRFCGEKRASSKAASYSYYSKSTFPLTARTAVGKKRCHSPLGDPVCRHWGSCLRGAAPMFRRDSR